MSPRPCCDGEPERKGIRSPSVRSARPRPRPASRSPPRCGLGMTRERPQDVPLHGVDPGGEARLQPCGQLRRPGADREPELVAVGDPEPLRIGWRDRHPGAVRDRRQRIRQLVEELKRTAPAVEAADRRADHQHGCEEGGASFTPRRNANAPFSSSATGAPAAPAPRARRFLECGQRRVVVPGAPRGEQVLLPGSRDAVAAAPPQVEQQVPLAPRVAQRADRRAEQAANALCAARPPPSPPANVTQGGRGPSPRASRP